MYLVPSTDYEQIRSLASGLQDQGMAQAVLQKARPGLVMTDDQSNPSALLIAAPEGAFAWTYLAGAPDSPQFLRDLNQWIFGEKGLGKNVEFSFLVCDRDLWEPSLATILKPRAVVSDRRLHYSAHHQVVGWEAAIPAGYRIVPIDQALISSGIALPAKVTEWITSNFVSKELFLEQGLGSVAIHDGKIVAWCLPDSVSGTGTDVGVETLEDHRRKGLAYCTTCQTLDQAFEKELSSVGWHCHVINTGSVKTAEKAGFELQYEYPAYVVHFDEEKHAKLAKMIGDEIVGHATEALNAGEHQEAHRLFEKALSFSAHTEATVYVMAARAAAGTRNMEQAFARLHQAVSLGWKPESLSAISDDFSLLRSDPRWERLAS